MTNAACTIVSKNYFAYAKTLRDSYLHHHPQNKFYILIVDRKTDDFLAAIAGVDDVEWVEELGIENFESYAVRYDILELNTNVKPSFLRKLTSKHNKVLYIDPDIQVFKPLEIIYDRLETSSIVLTPHITIPIDDKFKPGEASFLIAGEFNLGFIGVSAGETTSNFLRWWENRCLENGYNDPSVGLFVDQKWVNLVPCLFADTYIERSVGCNMAYWNLHERRLSSVDGEWFVNETTPLYFFHFSGLALGDANQVSKYQNRYDLDQRPDLKPAFDAYRQLLTKNGFSSYSKFSYGFGAFEDGQPISPLARRLYSIEPEVFGLDRPFSASSKFYDFCKKKRLFGKPPKSYTSYNTNNADYRLKAFRALLRLAFRVLGNERYQLLMKYMIFIGPARQQKSIFFEQD